MTEKSPIRKILNRRIRPRRTVAVLLACAGGAGVLVLFLAVPAAAATGHGVLAVAGPPSLTGVIDALRNWLVGLLAAVATLFLTIGGLRYLTAGGDPVQVERAKTALKSAAIGYALAALAPLLVSILTSVVG
ncbi:MAG: pilin [Acidimicrobiales bacterium]